MFHNFLPKEYSFFDLFDKQAACAVEAAAYFKDLVQRANIDEAAYEKMHDIEHKGDDVAHDIIDKLDKSFITPFDREDIHALVKELDDVTDMINTIVSRMKVYKIKGVDKNLVKFADVIEESVRSVSIVVKGMRNKKNAKVVFDSCIEINRLENVGDSLRDDVLAELFENEKDPITVIKLKEIYQDAETVLDICEDLAHVVKSVLLKQA
ncbi:MAG: DUF47 family protein [Candidatus Omnitrophica bacterium]|nr:DUF47 family protein [Candidatus Omnitrophota bacterium]